MKFDPKIHHRHSIRLPGYDYTSAGAYFLTIVTWQRQELFGEVVDGKMMLNKLGQVSQKQWEKLPQRFPHIELGEFVIMPNHMHGIIVIVDKCRGTAHSGNNPPSELTRRAPAEQFGKPVPGSIPTILRSYKSAVSLRVNLIRQTNGLSVWQRNYYEHIIRNEKDFQNKSDYIKNNPHNWQTDDENQPP